ncbi:MULTISPECIES: YceD family protein [Oleiagrimonas]|uniref:Large ribosomal RNA subunit accumulation protein YceD n=1 Tax=Oleiagrimonas citrea TaxID=1665687 RepID=A0A846ZJZ3_9GAMM|nr:MULTISPECIES: YceD family protein [Oleiagrimonas]NKZ37691.1 DNA-binding protein [Oleiagrimonas citrea]RAP56378.1 DNA-binding protein [Oleiagrimonas sp. MCCC 1A03011]
MSVSLPAFVDAWRMVEERRIFEGALPIAGFKRLRSLLADEAGEARYKLEFVRNELGAASLLVEVSASLTLICQRTLEPFVLPAEVKSRLGLIAHEREEAALAPEYEPLLVDADGRIDPAAVIEDELVLAVPLVPVSPTSEWPEEGRGAGPMVESDAESRENPFAVLRELKKH